MRRRTISLDILLTCFVGFYCNPVKQDYSVAVWDLERKALRILGKRSTFSQILCQCSEVTRESLPPWGLQMQQAPAAPGTIVGVTRARRPAPAPRGHPMKGDCSP